MIAETSQESSSGIATEVFMPNPHSPRPINVFLLAIILTAICSAEVDSTHLCRADVPASLARIDPQGIPGSIVLSSGKNVPQRVIEEFLKLVNRAPSPTKGAREILVISFGAVPAVEVDQFNKAIAARLASAKRKTNAKPKVRIKPKVIPDSKPKPVSKTNPTPVSRTNPKRSKAATPANPPKPPASAGAAKSKPSVTNSSPKPTSAKPTSAKPTPPKPISPKVRTITWSKAKHEAVLSMIAKSQAVWVSASNSAAAGEVLPQLASVLLAVQGRSGVVGGSGAIVESFATSLPGIHLRQADSNATQREVGKVDLALVAGTALVVRGRLMVSIGDANITITLPASANRKVRKIVLTKRKPLADLTALQRSLRNRLNDDFPPKKLAPPIVEHGTLIIIGGGGMPKGLLNRFVKLAGGKAARIVVLPTALPDPLPQRSRFAEALRKAGAGQVDVLTQRRLKDVESEAFLEPLRKASGVWFGGGRQWRFIDAYAGTKAEPLLHAVLKRGGVIAGSSAGASIQGDYLARANPLGNLDIMAEGYERGLRFLPGAAIDQHFTQRRRQPNMTSLIATYPQFLGIGIDETTAIVVQKGQAEIVGRNQVCFYDANKPTEPGKPDYESVFDGGSYDLVKRSILEIGKKPEVAKPVPPKPAPAKKKPTKPTATPPKSRLEPKSKPKPESKQQTAQPQKNAVAE